MCLAGREEAHEAGLEGKSQGGSTDLHLAHAFTGSGAPVSSATSLPTTKPTPGNSADTTSCKAAASRGGSAGAQRGTCPLQRVGQWETGGEGEGTESFVKASRHCGECRQPFQATSTGAQQLTRGNLSERALFREEETTLT